MKGASDDNIVITGMGLVCPLGRDLGRVWERVQKGDSGIRRWGDRTVALCGEYEEDPRRAIRFAREASMAALSDAGLTSLDSAGVDPARVGIALGNSKGGMAALEGALEEKAQGGSGAVASAMWNDFFHHGANEEVMQATGICGPCLSLVSACATGVHSIAQGARWILDGDADWVLSGATESSLTPLVLGGFDRMGVLASATPNEDPKTVCRPYDLARRGFVPGEGAGVVVLEKLSSAKKRGARVHAALAGWGFCADGYKPVAFNPSGDSIERAMGACLARAGWTVLDVDYVNCHGTGTRENDTMESRALRHLLGAGPQRTALSSTKPMTGHLLGAAGAVELILTVLALQYDFVPATLNLDHPDPRCDLDFTARIGRVREIHNAMSLSYGFGGHVAAVAVEKIGI